MMPAAAKAAFEKAKAVVASIESASTLTYFKQDVSIDAVQQTVAAAQARYQAQPHTKAYKWLTRLSSRITHYGSVLDVFAQYHPEYAALPWGTFKMLFIVRELVRVP
jgi:hypothetical protein